MGGEKTYSLKKFMRVALIGWLFFAVNFNLTKENKINPSLLDDLITINPKNRTYHHI